MKTNKVLRAASIGFIVLSALSLLSVSLMAFVSPQAVMDLVSVQLDNTDAFSSIRGVYGGVGLSIVIALILQLRTNRRQALLFLAIFWGLYAVSRLITIFSEGPLGAFGSQWIMTETVFCLIAVVLFVFDKKVPKRVNA